MASGDPLDPAGYQRVYVRSSDKALPANVVAKIRVDLGIDNLALKSGQALVDATGNTPPAGDNSDRLATTAFVAALPLDATGVQDVVDDMLDATLTPLHLYATGSPKAYPGRPVTDRPVVWASSDTAPPPPGTTSSGTGPVLGLDDVRLESGMTIAT